MRNYSFDKEKKLIQAVKCWMKASAERGIQVLLNQVSLPFVMAFAWSM